MKKKRKSTKEKVRCKKCDQVFKRIATEKWRVLCYPCWKQQRDEIQRLDDDFNRALLE